MSRITVSVDGPLEGAPGFGPADCGPKNIDRAAGNGAIGNSDGRGVMAPEAGGGAATVHAKSGVRLERAQLRRL